MAEPLGNVSASSGARLWRVRRGRHRMDAVLRQSGTTWALQFFRNDACLLTWKYDEPETARAEAETRLRELQRAGWSTHW